MTNNATNANEENTQGANGKVHKKVITADKVKSAYLEKEDMMFNEGEAAGAA